MYHDVSMSFPKMVANKTDSKCVSNKAFQPRAPETSLSNHQILSGILSLFLGGSCLKNYPFFVDVSLSSTD